MKNSRIGVLGGSFSPVHNGHIFLAKYVREHCDLDKVLMVPTGTHPFTHKQGKEIPSGEHRLKMLELALEEETAVEASDIEIRSPEISYTYNTLCRLREKYGRECRIFFIIGTDELMELDKWYEIEKMMKEFSFIVGIRPGYEIGLVKDKLRFYEEMWGADMMIINLPAPDVSSTDVRKAISGCRELTGMVPGVVCRYIKENKLYSEI